MHPIHHSHSEQEHLCIPKQFTKSKVLIKAAHSDYLQIYLEIFKTISKQYQLKDKNFRSFHAHSFTIQDVKTKRKSI